MSKEIENPDGTKEIVYTQAELDAQLKDKDDHHKKKIEEFSQAKTAQQLADEKRDAEIAAAKKISEDAMKKVETAEQGRITTVKNYIAEQFVGKDADLRKKLDEAFEVISAGRVAKGLDIASEAAIREIFTQASGMSGISAPAHPVFPMSGGGAPNFQPPAGQLSDAEHEAFKKATGYTDPKPIEAAK